jgi:hypothetical protein
MLLSSKRQIEPKKVKKPLKINGGLALAAPSSSTQLNGLLTRGTPSLIAFLWFFILCEKLIFKDLCLKENRVIVEEEGRGKIKIK